MSSGLVQVIVALCLLQHLLLLLFLTELSMKVGVVVTLESVLEVDSVVSSLVESLHGLVLHRGLIVLKLHRSVALGAADLILVVHVCLVVGLVACLHSGELHLVPITNGPNCGRPG